MIIIFDTQLNLKNFVWIELMRLYGFNIYYSLKVCSIFGILKFKKVKDISKDILKKLQSYIELEFNSELWERTYLNWNIEQLKLSHSKKGMHHIYFLPVRNQKTKRNAKTQKHKKKKL